MEEPQEQERTKLEMIAFLKSLSALVGDSIRENPFERVYHRRY
jgi:hypothetical protein